MQLARLKLVKNGRFRYFRAPGGKLYPLPNDVPIGHARFLKAYAELEAEHAPNDDAQVDYPSAPTLRSAALAYFKTRKFADLKPSTQAVRRRLVERIVDNRDDVTIRSLRHRHIQKDIDDVPSGSADARLDTWRALMKVSIRNGWIKTDPSAAVELPRHKTKPHPRWTSDDARQFCERWPLGTQQRTAFELLYWTSCRRGDVVTMGWQHVKDGWLVWRQQKTDELVELPIAPPLGEALSHCSRTQLTFLQTANGQSRSGNAFGEWFRRACAAAGVTKTAHGLRHDFGSTLAEAQADKAAGMAAMGHSSESEQDTYRSSVNRRRLAERAMERLLQERGLETRVVKIGNRRKKK
ncbi:MAG: tyrosine-type recombinase/integrase [Pseudomonadota bacterium]